ncbi:uncharacterized protein [Anabrus simplex]|uniref:uncharacterized protein isoform X2 n=1 Tax=Anabrus simplex TaxID=316456 RepID=UPI0035A2FEA4
MTKYLFLSSTLLIISLVTAARVPVWEPLSNLRRVDPDAVKLYNNALDENEQRERTMSSKDTKLLEKRKYGGYSYPSSSRGLPSATKNNILKNIEGKVRVCDTQLEIPEHASKACKNFTGCRVECDEGYMFEDGNPYLMFVCTDNEWKANGMDYSSVPECVLDEDESEEDPCKAYEATEHSRVNCPANTYCELRCHKGYKLPGNKNYLGLFCREGVWSADTEDGEVPLCEPEEPVCEGEPSALPRTTVKCQSDRICEASCEKGYKFPSGASSVVVSCTAGGWTVQAEEEDGTTGCVRELLTCSGQELTKLKNATIECDDTSCTANCVDGHKFPNGNPSINIVCGKSRWEVQGIGWESVPDCVQELKTNTKCNGSQYLVFPNLGAYKVNTSHVTWADAQKTCIHEGAHLAIIDSKEELELMKDLIAPHHVKNGWTYAHVGFSDLAKRGVWVTVLGTILDSVHFAKWAPRNPSKLNERCGAIDHKGRLHDIFCTSEQIFICEKM